MTTNSNHTPEERLTSLGIELPEPPGAVAAYEPWIKTNQMIVTSGQLPWEGDEMVYAGKLGTDLSVEDGYEASRLAILNAVAQLKDAVGELSKINQIVRVEGNVHTSQGFQQHATVLDGASDLLSEIFGPRSGHTRTALGTNEMPLDAAVQLSVWADVE